MLNQLHMQQTNRPIDVLLLWNRDKDSRLLLDPPYQRGDVWGFKRRQNFIRSILLGVPIPSMIVNDRMNAEWRDDFRIAVIDGKQRITTLLMLLEDRLPIPGDWIGSPAKSILFSQMSKRCRRKIGNCLLPFSEGRLRTLDAEKEVFDLVNFGGLSQGESDDEPLSICDRCPMESPVAPLIALGYRFGVDKDQVIMMKNGRRIPAMTLVLEIHKTELEPQVADVLPAIADMLNRVSA